MTLYAAAQVLEMIHWSSGFLLDVESHTRTTTGAKRRLDALMPCFSCCNLLAVAQLCSFHLNALPCRQIFPDTLLNDGSDFLTRGVTLTHVLCTISGMTLIAGFRANKGGILLGADREENDGFSKREVGKISRVSNLQFRLVQLLGLASRCLPSS